MARAPPRRVLLAALLACLAGVTCAAAYEATGSTSHALGRSLLAVKKPPPAKVAAKHQPPKKATTAKHPPPPKKATTAKHPPSPKKATTAKHPPPLKKAFTKKHPPPPKKVSTAKHPPPKKATGKSPPTAIRCSKTAYTGPLACQFPTPLCCNGKCINPITAPADCAG